MFDLNLALADWRRSLRKFESLEDGNVAELESHLLDEYDRQKRQGLTDETAFARAVEAVGRPDAVAGEYFKDTRRSPLARPRWQTTRFSPAMIWNYLKIAGRKTMKQKGYSLINIAGLAIGMAGALLIWQWVLDESSFDCFHAKADRIYRIVMLVNTDGQSIAQANTSGLLSATLKAECPEVEAATSVRSSQNGTLVEIGQQKFLEPRIGMADSSFFSIFTFPLLVGNASTALAGPQDAVISETAAQKYFGPANPLGQVIRCYDREFKVNGVFRDMPPNSHFHLDVICSYASFDYARDWDNNNFKTYVLLRPDSRPSSLQAKLREIMKKHFFHRPGQFEAEEAKGNSFVLKPQPLTDIHLHSDLKWEFEPNGNAAHVQFFKVIALFVLLIAAVNYINLATARSAGRAREVGIRKTLGSSRLPLVGQFMSESVLTCLLALGLTLILVQLWLPGYRALVGKPWLQLFYFQNPWVLLLLLGLAAGIGLLAGLYPAFVLSAFKPAAVVSGRLSRGGHGSRLRYGLVLVQFALSIFLLVGTLVVHRQMAFMQNRNLGFDREQVVVVRTNGQLDQKLPAFKHELEQNPAVLGVTASSSVPGRTLSNRGSSQEAPRINFPLNVLAVDYDFLSTLKITLAAGRFFAPERGTDGRALVLNEAAVQAFGGGDPLAKRIRVSGLGEDYLPVIGVVKDFHYESLHQTIQPLGLLLLGGDAGPGEAYVSIRLRAEGLPDTLDFVQRSWSRTVPGSPFEYSFLDAIYDGLYQSEARTGRVFTAFTLLAIFVACLGLFGLAAFAAEQRTKEIGIRKVYGASVAGLVLKLTGDFTRWVLLANLVAWPAAYLAMTRWLQNFAYRIEVSPVILLAAGALAFLIAWLMVGFQTFRAARARPAERLRYE